MNDSKYGWKPDIPDCRDWPFRPSRGNKAELPEKASLKHIMPPVYKQGSIGDCTAHAVVSLYVYHHVSSGGKRFTPSPMFVYYNTRMLENTTQIDCGASIRSAIKATVKYGVCNYECWPSDETKLRTRPYKRCYTQAQKKPTIEYFRVDQSLHNIRVCLFQNKPVACGIAAYESYELPQVARTGFIDRPAFTERCLGGHAIVLTGYDDTTNLFEFRNSHGSEWGIDGYGTIPYSYILDRYLSDDFWTINHVEPLNYEATSENQTGRVKG